MEKNKRGNMELVVPAVLTIAFMAILLIFVLILLSELLSNTADTAYTINNETLTTVDDSGEYTKNISLCGFNSFTVTSAHVATGVFTELIDPGNYTVESSGRVYYSSTIVNASINGTNWNISGTLNYGDNEACYAGNETVSGMGKFGDYTDLIVLAVVISIIVGLLLVVFSTSKVR